MADIVDGSTRSRMMSAIRSKNTRAELLVRKSLFARGFRYSIHNAGLPGKPDIVLKKYNTVIQIHGCFWHGHDNCHLFRYPASRQEFWYDKIDKNRERDRINEEKLLNLGWRVLIVWECAIKGRYRHDPDTITESIIYFMKYSDDNFEEIRGRIA